MIRFLTATIAALSIGTSACSEEMKMAVTTSFHNSGLADVLLPEISKDTGIDVHLLVVGTGQALRLGEAGDVDAILVHARQAEEEFVAAGNATHRTEIMYNDFVFVGPIDDAAGVGSAVSAADALRRIARNEEAFVSRGDDSGTHKKELNLWEQAGISPEGKWYNAVGAGMGAALNTASGMSAYILSDRASWLNFGNKGDLALLFADDPELFNQYAFLPVSSEKHSHVKAELAERLEGWLTSDRAKELTDGYRLEGEQLFTFNARR